MPRKLMDDWPYVADRLRAAGSVALFLDFDGTLAPTVGDPQKAAIDRAARNVLRFLATNPGIRVCVISGRREADVRALVGIRGIDYLGVHGGDSPGRPLPAASVEAVAGARRELAARLNGAKSNGTGGISIEDKRVAFAVHFRHASGATTKHTRDLLAEVLASRSTTLRIMPGDCVWEVLPREIAGKGAAVRHLWRSRSPASLPIYVGNDATDESAYRALEDGITVRVGTRHPTHARYSLKDPREVARFLELLERATSRGCSGSG